MTYNSLLEFVGGVPCFDLPLLVQGFDEERASIRVQLSRWMKQGKVIGLRRGMYTLPGAFRRAPLTPAALANQLYKPSYLSGLWALAHHDMIPEQVIWLTSVTPRVPRRFENPFGVFDYRNIKQSAFFGYAAVQYAGQDVLVAEAEKALLDHWHLTAGEWTTPRLEQMRYQHAHRVTEKRLRRGAERFRSPRLERAVERWLALTAGEEEGTVTL